MSFEAPVVMEPITGEQFMEILNKKEEQELGE